MADPNYGPPKDAVPKNRTVSGARQARRVEQLLSTNPPQNTYGLRDPIAIRAYYYEEETKRRRVKELQKQQAEEAKRLDIPSEAVTKSSVAANVEESTWGTERLEELPESSEMEAVTGESEAFEQSPERNEFEEAARDTEISEEDLESSDRSTIGQDTAREEQTAATDAVQSPALKGSYLRRKAGDHAIIIHEMNKDRSKLISDRIDFLRDRHLDVPKFLARVDVKKGPKHTKSHSQEDVFIPTTDWDRGSDCHDHLHDMTISNVASMVGGRVLWLDLNEDECQSFSNSPFFCLNHLHLRITNTRKRAKTNMIARTRQYHAGVYFVEPDMATKPATRTAEAGRPAEFHWTPDLLREYGVRNAKCWDIRRRARLHPRISNHEYLSHGTVICKDNPYAFLTYKAIKDAGVYEMVPELLIPTQDLRRLIDLNDSLANLDQDVDAEMEHEVYDPGPNTLGYSTNTDKSAKIAWQRTTRAQKRYAKEKQILDEIERLEKRTEYKSTPLFERSAASRIAVFRNQRASPIPQQHLDICIELAQLSVRFPGDTPRDKIKAPLHLVLWWMSLRPRRLQDPLLMKFIKDNYEPIDVTKYLYRNMHEVPDNLPEVKQYVALMRDACVAVGVEPIRPTIDLEYENITAIKRLYVRKNVAIPAAEQPASDGDEGNDTEANSAEHNDAYDDDSGDDDAANNEEDDDDVDDDDSESDELDDNDGIDDEPEKNVSLENDTDKKARIQDGSATTRKRKAHAIEEEEATGAGAQENCVEDDESDEERDSRTGTSTLSTTTMVKKQKLLNQAEDNGKESDEVLQGHMNSLDPANQAILESSDELCKQQR